MLIGIESISEIMPQPWRCRSQSAPATSGFEVNLETFYQKTFPEASISFVMVLYEVQNFLPLDALVVAHGFEGGIIALISLEKEFFKPVTKAGTPGRPHADNVWPRLFNYIDKKGHLSNYSQ
jgi:hypothetical protein